MQEKNGRMTWPSSFRGTFAPLQVGLLSKPATGPVVARRSASLLRLRRYRYKNVANHDTLI